MNRSSSHAPPDSRLLNVAIDLFGQVGLDGVSTRELASLANTQMSSIGYHFGSKVGLHLAAAQHIADTIGARVRPLLVAARELRKSSDDAEVARLALRQILIGMLNVIVTEEFAADSRFVAREQANPGAAFEILFREVMEPMLDELSRLIACISGNQMSTQECRTRSVVLIGQVLVFRMAHATALRAAGWSSIDEGGVRLLRHVIDEHVVAICDRIEAAEPAQPKYIK